MPQTSGGASFALESLDKFLVAHELWRNQLQSDITIGSHMRGQIHGAHPAPAEQTLKAVFFVENLTDVTLEITHGVRTTCGSGWLIIVSSQLRSKSSTARNRWRFWRLSPNIAR